jgi:hypothetical protein
LFQLALARPCASRLDNRQFDIARQRRIDGSQLLRAEYLDTDAGLDRQAGRRAGLDDADEAEPCTLLEFVGQDLYRRCVVCGHRAAKAM